MKGAEGLKQLLWLEERGPNNLDQLKVLQRDVVYLGWPIAPSYMSPNAGRGGELRGSQLCTWSPNKFWRSNSIFNLYGSVDLGFHVIFTKGEYVLYFLYLQIAGLLQWREKVNTSAKPTIW